MLLAISWTCTISANTMETEQYQVKIVEGIANGIDTYFNQYSK